MSKAQRFEDLTIFQMARDLCKEVYAVTKEGEFHKDSRFVQQIHASAGSVMDNIAEGYERDGNKEFINFLYIAKGSCGEVRSQIIFIGNKQHLGHPVPSVQKFLSSCIIP